MGRAGSPRPLSWVEDATFSLCPHVVVFTWISSLGDTGPVELRPTPRTSFELNYLYKDLSPNVVTF